MPRMDTFLRLVAEQGASDLHFHAGNVPIIRHEGELVPLPFRLLSRDEAERFILDLMTPEQREGFEKTSEADFVYTLPAVGRFRANVFVQSQGIGAVFRVIPNVLPTIEDLGLPPSVKRLADLQNGLVLVTGPTGSGKTTTLTAMVNHINRSSHRHVITIEDPIEHLHAPGKGVVTQRQVGKHAASFSAALRSALRESPDVLVVGELRDPETIALAISAAETGVLVIGTLHANGAAKAIDRILDVIPEEGRDQVRSTLSVLLRGVIAQHLARRATGEGRVAVLEILLQSHAVANLIREGKVHQIDGYLDSTSNDGSGATSLDAALFRLIRDGQLAVAEALKLANQPATVQRLVAELPED